MSWGRYPFSPAGDDGTDFGPDIHNNEGIDASVPLDGVQFYQEMSVDGESLPDERPPTELTPASPGAAPSWLLPAGLAIVAGGIAYAMTKRNRWAWAAAAAAGAAFLGPPLIRRFRSGTGLGARKHFYGGGAGGGDV